MAYYTLGQAAKATGKTKTTISNAIKKGRISAEKNDSGHYQIEASELHRVFDPIQTKQSIDRQKMTVVDPSLDPESLLDNRVIQQLLKAKDKEIELKEDLINQVKSERDKIYGLITNQSEQASREVESLRARIEQAEAEKDRMKKAAQQWKERAEAEQSKPWYKKLFG
jgi:predicted site-specific integrase-resolvase